MVFLAKHKKTGQIVSSNKVQIDSSWIGTFNDEWIAIDSDVLNLRYLWSIEITEVPLIFIKSFERNVDGNRQLVRCHFRKNLDEANLREGSAESEQHKLAKEKIYDLIWDKDIKFDIGNEIKSIDNLPAFDTNIESRLSADIQSKIADVLIKFESRDEVLGNGIVLEIQFSKQSNDKTYERTWQRVQEGYTVVWLFQDDFDDDINLIDKIIIVKPFARVYEEYREYSKELSNDAVREASLKMDLKIQNFERYKDIVIADIDFSVKGALGAIEIKKNELKQEMTKSGDSLIREANMRIDASLRSMIDIQKTQMNDKVKDMYLEVKEDVIKNLLLDADIEKTAKDKVNEIITASFDKGDFKKEIESESNNKINSMKNEIIQKAVSTINDALEKKVQDLIDRKDYDELLKKRFGTNLGEFARTYLDAKLYELKKEVNKK